MKSERTQTDGEIYRDHGLEESILWKWVYYPKQSINAMQSLSNYQWYFFTELEQIISQFLWKYKRSGHGRRKEIIKIRVEINEIETKKIIIRINETNSWFFEKINKIDKPLVILIKKCRGFRSIKLVGFYNI